MPAVLIVESISSTSADVIYCIGKSRWGNRPGYSQRMGKVRELVPVWFYDRGGQYVVDALLEISEDLKTLHGEAKGRGLRTLGIIMKKIED